MPPQKAKAVITTSGPSISARRRSMSQPPMIGDGIGLAADAPAALGVGARS